MSCKVFLSLLLAVSIYESASAISAYWTPILPQVCAPTVPKNVTQSLYSCDKLMDKQLSTIFDQCVRNVNRMGKEERLGKPKLCYYARQGMQLDRCKMARYQSEGITLPELVEREQDHTWCLMKIAQPLGWEGLCSDNPVDVSFVMANHAAIQNCENRFIEITNPIRECFRDEVLRSTSSSIFNRGRNKGKDRLKPAACLSFQYSRKIWKCLAQRDTQRTMQRRANLYVACLRAIRQAV